MITGNIELTMKMLLPINKPDRNGIMYSKEVFINAFKGAKDKPLEIINDDGSCTCVGFVEDMEYMKVESYENGWIKCEPGNMPEDNKIYNGKHVINCLVTTATGKVTKVQRIQYKNYDGKFDNAWYWGRVFGECTAWQHLPDPYKCK